jgi:hypothetical protein
MDLISILWITVGAGALIFSGDALAARISRRGHLSPAHRKSSLVFGLLMLLFAMATLAVIVIERHV